MSGLSALKLVQAKRQAASSPQHARRQKLSSKLAEQIQLAKAQQAGTEFSPVRVRTVKDEATGESRQVEYPSSSNPGGGPISGASCASPFAMEPAPWRLWMARTPLRLTASPM